MTSDYTRLRPALFPRELAEMIASKADAMARSLEDQAVRQMVRDAQRALDRGISQDVIAREMGLTPRRKTTEI